MDAESASVSVGERPTVSQTGERLIEQLEVYGLRPTTITIYRSLVRTHLSKHLGDRELARVTPSEVERMITAMRRNGAGPKLITMRSRCSARSSTTASTRAHAVPTRCGK